MRAVVGRASPPPGISSAAWLRAQRPAREVFPKSMAQRTRPFIASTHSHGKHEIHITRSLSLRLDEQGLGGVRGCAKQLGVFTMLWSSAGADVQHLVIACCRLVWRSAGEAARELFRRRPSYLLELVTTTGWPIPSRKNADMSAVRRGEPARAPIATVHRGCLGGCPADEPPRHPGPYRANWRAVRCQGPPGPCLGAAGHLAGRVRRACGAVLDDMFVVYNKPEQNNRGVTRLS